MYCDLFKIYCALPNLGITRMWICWLNLAQRPIFSGLSFFNDPEISDLGPPAERPEKIHWPQPGLNSRTLDHDASTLPRDLRDNLLKYSTPLKKKMHTFVTIAQKIQEAWMPPWQSVFIGSKPVLWSTLKPTKINVYFLLTFRNSQHNGQYFRVSR